VNDVAQGQHAQICTRFHSFICLHTIYAVHWPVSSVLTEQGESASGLLTAGQQTCYQCSKPVVAGSIPAGRTTKFLGDRTKEVAIPMRNALNHQHSLCIFT